MTTLRFTRIDDSNRGGHSSLAADDECYFLGERTAGENYAFSETNQLIANLKISPLVNGTPRWYYKNEAIKQCAKLLDAGLNAEWLKTATLVPVPPSKVCTDPEYDDRMLRVLQAIPKPNLDIRELETSTDDAGFQPVARQ